MKLQTRPCQTESQYQIPNPATRFRFIYSVPSCLRTGFTAVLCLSALCLPHRGSAQQLETNETQRAVAALNAQKELAMERVRKIVNQPVTRYLRQRGMRVGRFSPGWFHPGATIPDFDTVDVRQSQEFPYSDYDYVTSDLNPGVVFIGRQLEFNAMTKYFYTDRTVPKKRLTEAEMLEVNRLYRVIGHCEDEIRRLEHPESFTSEPNETAQVQPKRKPFFQRVPRSNYIKGGLGVAAVLALYVVYRMVRK